MMRKYRLFFLVLLLWSFHSSAQTQYNAQQAFRSLPYQQTVNRYHSADGTPGPDYWQNNADYDVKAAIDTTHKTLTGTVVIHYKNNSPDALPMLWLQMDQNQMRNDSRGSMLGGYYGQDSPAQGFELKTVKIKLGDTWQKADYIVDDSRMQIRLAQPVMAGDNIEISIDYTFHFLKNGGRSGYLDTKNGQIFEFSYWYPRMCVYDANSGWNALPFLGSGEFYLDYGDINYSITLPEGMLVAGSGALKNAEEVLPKAYLKALDKARDSDKTITIRGEKDLKDKPTVKGTNGQLTWNFTMKNTRDVAFAASSAFIWDAAKVNLPEGKTCLAMSFYPEESKGNAAWGRATEYLKHSIEIFSDKWFAYPYPVAINVGGPVGGMEYPGITFDHWKATGKNLWALLSHEIGHNWFPMIVGSDERRYAWMDEGFNTFVDIYASEAYNNGEYAPKRDGEYAPKGGNPAEEIIPFMIQQGIPAVDTPADMFERKDLHPVEYFKTAYGLVLLREVILGPERFDYAFRKYVHAWAYKHPTPYDFYKTMNNYAGEDLSWFWKGWFQQNWLIDQAVTAVKYTKDDPSEGSLITIKNKEKLPMPITIQVTTADGKTSQYSLPVEVWLKGDTFTFHAPTAQKITKVVLDPKHVLPDLDQQDNAYSVE